MAVLDSPSTRPVVPLLRGQWPRVHLGALEFSCDLMRVDSQLDQIEMAFWGRRLS